jgi:FkbM family methyltransferase
VSEKLADRIHQGPDVAVLFDAPASMAEKKPAIPPPPKKQKQRSLRRVIREIARPFRQVSLMLRNLTGLRSDIGNIERSLGVLMRRMKRQPIPISEGLLLLDLDDRHVAVPSSDFALVAHLINAPVYEPGVTAVLGRLAMGKAYAIDVGANIGLHSITMARGMRPDGKILALEPTPRTYEALQASLLLNALLPRVDARQVAAGERPGEALLHCHPVSGLNSLFSYPDRATKQVSVAVAPLDALVPTGTSVDLVKIDAEGAELDILKGMRRILEEAHDIAVVLEFSATHFQRAGVSPSELISFMERFGLVPQRIDDWTGQLEPFDLTRVLALPAANVLFHRVTPGSTDRLGERPQ